LAAKEKPPAEVGLAHCSPCGEHCRGIVPMKAGQRMGRFWRALLPIPVARKSKPVVRQQLKTLQEVITLLVFASFSMAYLKEPMTWNYAIGFALIATGAYFVFRGPFSASLF
jgi:hypothetical protein